MTIIEDTAALYARKLATDCLGRDIANDEEGKGMGSRFNSERMKTPDTVFNYSDPDTFANEVYAIFQKNYPRLVTRYDSIIKHIAKEYAIKRIAFVKGSAAKRASVATNSFFNY